ncbi:chitinase C-terminal domain-containing protein [Vibrio lentus]|nr:chitinase C-terminal domain-containing protein [Vibrio lentus]
MRTATERLSIRPNKRNSGNGEFHMGNTMTKAIYDKFKSATPYGNKVATVLSRQKR